MATELDYYTVLGVERGASDAEIKRAFRKLAQQWHPDVNADPAAQERFKEINEAYQVLSDPDRRQRYDMFGRAGVGGGGEGDFGFGGGFGRLHGAAEGKRHAVEEGTVILHVLAAEVVPRPSHGRRERADRCGPGITPRGGRLVVPAEARGHRHEQCRFGGVGHVEPVVIDRALPIGQHGQMGLETHATL